MYLEYDFHLACLSRPSGLTVRDVIQCFPTNRVSDSHQGAELPQHSRSTAVERGRGGTFALLES